MVLSYTNLQIYCQILTSPTKNINTKIGLPFSPSSSEVKKQTRHQQNVCTRAMAQSWQGDQPGLPAPAPAILPRAAPEDPIQTMVAWGFQAPPAPPSTSQGLLPAPSPALATQAARTIAPIPGHGNYECYLDWLVIMLYGIPAYHGQYITSIRWVEQYVQRLLDRDQLNVNAPLWWVPYGAQLESGIFPSQGYAFTIARDETRAAVVANAYRSSRGYINGQPIQVRLSSWDEMRSRHY